MIHLELDLSIDPSHHSTVVAQLSTLFDHITLLFDSSSTIDLVV